MPVKYRPFLWTPGPFPQPEEDKNSSSDESTS